MSAYNLPPDFIKDFRDLKRRVSDLWRKAAVPRVTSLPSSPTDGQVIDYVADATNGVIWRFRYNADSSSAYKWEFVGGASLFQLVATSQSTSSTSYTDLTTVGPTVTAPLAGDYDVEIGAFGRTNSAGATARMSYSVGGAAATDADSIRFDTAAANNGLVSSKLERKTGLSAATALKAKYMTGAGTALFLDRWMRVLPVRVG